MDTGHAVTLGAAAARNLLRVADFLPPPYLIGVLLVAFHPRAKRLGDMVAGTVVSRDRPQERAGADARAAAEDEPACRFPSWTTRRSGCCPSSRPVRVELAPAARDAGRRGPGRPGWPTTRRPPGQSDLAHLLALHAAELARRQGGLSARGAAGAGTRFAAQKRPPLGRVRAAGGARRAAGSRQLRLARAARLRRPLPRGRRRPGAGPHLPGRRRPPSRGWSGWRSPGTTRSTGTSGAPGAGSGWCSRASAPRPSSRRAATCWSPSSRSSLPAAAGFMVLHERPALAAELLPDVMLRRAEAGAARKAAGRGYVDIAAEDRPLMASGIITNNVRVAIACFAGGIFLGVGSLVLLAYNGLAIGAFAGHFANAGLLDYLLTFILGHGALELFAIWVAGAAGFMLGRSAVAPGRLSRADALVLSGRVAVRMLGATALLLVVAGLIEGFVSAGGYSLGVRLLASAASLGLLGGYLLTGVRARAASSASGSPALRSPAGS